MYRYLQHLNTKTENDSSIRTHYLNLTHLALFGLIIMRESVLPTRKKGTNKNEYIQYPFALHLRLLRNCELPPQCFQLYSNNHFQ